MLWPIRPHRGQIREFPLKLQSVDVCFRFPTTATRGRPSECEPFRTTIAAKLELGLSDLVSDHGFAGGYDSVKRFVRQLGRSRALPIRRMERAAGEEAQVDFGTGAPVTGPDGKRRKTHVFRVVLQPAPGGWRRTKRSPMPGRAAARLAAMYLSASILSLRSAMRELAPAAAKNRRACY